MTFLVGKTQGRTGVTGETSGLHNDLIQMLQSGGLQGAFPGYGYDPKSIQPFLDLFTQQNARNFAQAKESAGNLTGSGLASAIGGEASRANVEQGAFLAQFLEARRQADANRAANLTLGALGSPAGQLQYTYTPGLLDYLGQGATALAGGGAFNKLFGGDGPRSGT